jgi:D-alanine-D-alanine ligase
MEKLVLIVFGGESWEREGSILSAATVARSLDRQGISNRLVEFPLNRFEISDNSKAIVFNAMHGKNGEDGTISMLCEIYSLPYNFSRPFAHLVGFNKLRFKSLAYSLGIVTASVLNEAEVSNAKFPLPIEVKVEGKKYILKPIFGGGSKGVQVIAPNEDIKTKIVSRDKKFDPYFVEEFIDGIFVTCVVTGRTTIDSSLPLLEVHFNGEVYDYESKHTESKREYILPAQISAKCESIIRESAHKMFFAMGCDPIVRFDWLVSPEGIPYLLEANTVPGITEAGNMASIWKASGRTYDELVYFLLQQAR